MEPPAALTLGKQDVMNSGSKLLFISASAGKVSRCEMLVDVISTMLGGHYTQMGHVRVRELPAGALLSSQIGDVEIARALQLVEDAQAIVIVTPVYKGSYSGLLKAFLDILPQYGMRGKYILPFAVGGSLAHMQMLDYSLRPVLQTMWPAHIGQGSFVLDQHILQDKNMPSLADGTLSIVRDAIEGFTHLLDKQLG